MSERALQIFVAHSSKRGWIVGHPERSEDALRFPDRATAHAVYAMVCAAYETGKNDLRKDLAALLNSKDATS